MSQPVITLKILINPKKSNFLQDSSKSTLNVKQYFPLSEQMIHLE